jgi:Acetyltransferase (GNAT) domain
MMRLVAATARQLETWDERVAASFNGTIFHRRAFLGYHGSRFADSERFLMALDGDAPCAQIALTIEATPEGRVARSPYGASYGGFVLFAQPGFDEAQGLVRALNEYLGGEGAGRFVMTPPTACCAPQPLDVLNFAFLTNGYRSINRDLSSIVDLRGPEPVAASVSSRARNMLRKAESHGFRVHRGNLDDFWRLMDKTFDKHGARPTHTREEFARLVAALPDQVQVDIAYDPSGEAVAGIGYMAVNRRVNMSFYFCQDPERRKEQALTLLIMHALERSRAEGFSYFDFGTSSVNMVPRENIFRFKEAFSKSAVFRETFEWRAA